MIIDKFAAPPKTPCDPGQIRDLVKAWRCTTVGPCECGARKTIDAAVDSMALEFTAKD